MPLRDILLNVLRLTIGFIMQIITAMAGLSDYAFAAAVISVLIFMAITILREYIEWARHPDSAIPASPTPGTPLGAAGTPQAAPANASAGPESSRSPPPALVASPSATAPPQSTLPPPPPPPRRAVGRSAVQDSVASPPIGRATAVQPQGSPTRIEKRSASAGVMGRVGAARVGTSRAMALPQHGRGEPRKHREVEAEGDGEENKEEEEGDEDEDEDMDEYEWEDGDEHGHEQEDEHEHEHEAEEEEIVN